MKFNLFFSILFFGSGLYGQTIPELPGGEYADRGFSNREIDQVTALSTAFRGAPKITEIRDDGIVTGTETWPAGSWGRGYQTWPTWTHPVFMTNRIAGSYYAHHPLMRDASAFFRGHLHLYLAGYTGPHETIIRDGIDYILSEQWQTGRETGGFTWWVSRDGLNDTAMTHNTPHLYETAYALAALSEYYLSGFYHRREEVLSAIRLASGYVNRTTWRKMDNANMRGLALWSLSAAYKATQDKKVMKEIRRLADWLIDHQYKADDEDNGLWKTGGLDKGKDCGYYHDTRIMYHFFVVRGLVEAYSVIPEKKSRLRTRLAATIKRAIGHVIRYRLVSTDPKNAQLYDLHRNSCGDKVTAAASFLNEVECSIDAVAKLVRYTQHDPCFSAEENGHLQNLLNKLAGGLNPSEKWHFSGIGLYVNHQRALREGTSVYRKADRVKPDE